MFGHVLNVLNRCISYLVGVFDLAVCAPRILARSPSSIEEIVKIVDYKTPSLIRPIFSRKHFAFQIHAENLRDWWP